jgi:hypothetical protein
MHTVVGNALAQFRLHGLSRATVLLSHAANVRVDICGARTFVWRRLATPLMRRKRY